MQGGPMLILAVHVTIKAGHEDEVIDAFHKLQTESRLEPGCVEYVVQRSRENRRRFLIYEQYVDDAALDAHRNSPHFKTYATGGFYKFVEDRHAEFFDPV
jgi:quinol monooxygenase YgiN